MPSDITVNPSDVVIDGDVLTIPGQLRYAGSDLGGALVIQGDVLAHGAVSTDTSVVTTTLILNSSSGGSPQAFIGQRPDGSLNIPVDVHVAGTLAADGSLLAKTLILHTEGGDDYFVSSDTFVKLTAEIASLKDRVSALERRLP